MKGNSKAVVEIMPKNILNILQILKKLNVQKNWTFYKFRAGRTVSWGQIVWHNGILLLEQYFDTHCGHAGRMGTAHILGAEGFLLAFSLRMW